MHGTRPRSSNAISSKDSMLGPDESQPGRLCSAVAVMPAVVMPAGAACVVMAVMPAVPRAGRGVAAAVIAAMMRARTCAASPVVGLAEAEHVGIVALGRAAVPAISGALHWR